MSPDSIILARTYALGSASHAILTVASTVGYYLSTILPQ